MFKQAWRSYLASLHPRNYKKIKDSVSLGIWIYFLVISPIMRDWADGEDAIEQMSFYMANLSPYLLMLWSNLEQKLPMPKQMYLVPMKPGQRAEYVRDLIIIKISFPALVGCIVHIIRGFMYGMEPIRIMLCTLAVISFGIGMYVCSSLRSKFDRYIRYAVRGEDGTGKDAVLNWSCMIYSIIFHFFASAVEVEISVGPSIWDQLFFGWMPILIMIIIDIAIIATRFLWTVVDTCNYEENFKIFGKVK